MQRLVHLEIDGATVTWRVLHATRTESLHAAYSLVLTVDAIDASGLRTEVVTLPLITRRATVTWPISGGADRTFEGVVDGIEELGTGFRISVVPRVALLRDAVDHQVFLGVDAVAIVKQVLAEHDIHIESKVARTLSKRSQCVQAFESDLAFVSRLLAEEGITWRLGEKPDLVVLTDDAAAFSDVVALPVREQAGMLTGEAVHEVRLRQTVVADSVRLRDYDFTTPMVDLSTRASAGKAPRELYEYPGRYADLGTGNALANIRLEEARARRVVLSAESNSSRIAPGVVVELDGSPRRSVNAKWLVLRVAHAWRVERSSEPEHQVRFTAVPATENYRPPRARAAQLGGVQTATIAGPTGVEIHTEQYGQVRALHRWDRRSPKTDRCSAWMRVIQPPTSGGFLLPRVGWEALVGFAGASGDTPIVMGRLYNGEAPPPDSLPAKKVVSAFGSLTTPGGGSANLVAMDDSKGNEGMTFNASKNFNERTENDKVTSVTAMDAHEVAADRALIVGQVHQVGVAGAQSYSVAGSRTVNVDANKGISAASEAVSIGGSRLFTIGGDYGTSCSGLTRLVGAAKVETAIEHQTRTVKGASTVMVGATWKVAAGTHASVSVSGASVETVGGAKSVSTGTYALSVRGALKETLASRKVASGGDHIESFGGAASYSIASSAKLKGANVVVRASSKLTIKAGGVTIEMTPSAITVNGEFDGGVASVDEGDEKYE